MAQNEVARSKMSLTIACADVAEPADDARVSQTNEDETTLRVAFYNVGMMQTSLESYSRDKSEQRCIDLADDIAAGFRLRHLHLLLLCELGEHCIGVQGRLRLNCQTQEELLGLIVDITNEKLSDGAEEPVVQVK